MVRMAGVVTAIVLAAGAAANAQQSQGFGLGPYLLGMTDAEVKAIPMEGYKSTYLPDRPAIIPIWSCTGDARSPAILARSTEEISIGNVECTPVERAAPIGTYQPPNEQTSIKFGRIFLKPVMEFYDGRLITITTSQHMNWKDDFYSALVEKYGKPKASLTGEAQNSFGAKWPTTTHTWAAGGSTIVMTFPAIDKDSFAVIYSDGQGAAARDRALNAAKGSLGI